MAAKTPIRAVYTGANATGLAEYQSGEFIDYTFGGTGLAALGTAGQVLKTNSGANAIEWGTIAGDIEGVTAGTGLSGGGTSGTVTVANSVEFENSRFHECIGLQTKNRMIDCSHCK